MNTSLRLPVSDSSQAGQARRTAAAWAKGHRFKEEISGNLALVVTELATNLALHTRGGVLLLRRLASGENCGVEVLSLDSGPGVANFSECLRDGYSTAGTAGTGLGAVRRASRVFDVHSQTGIGTALLSEIWEKSTLPPDGFKTGAASTSMDDGDDCGDSWSALELRADRVRLLVADGLGHGILAADASRKAVEVFSKNVSLSLLELLENMHVALRSTRGAAVAVAEIDTSKQVVTYAGLGNISATIVHRAKTLSLVSHNGTAGAQYRKLQQFTYPWESGASLIMHTDGIKTNWNLDRYLGLSEKHPSLIAGILYRDFQRSNDDSTVVVLRGRV